MRRLSVGFVLVVVLLVVMALPVGAAPTNGNSARNLTLDCNGGGPVVVSVQWETESAAVFDIAEGNGRQYVLSSAHFSVFDSSNNLVFDSEKHWGKRTGYNERMTCTGSAEDVGPTGEVFTAKFEVVLAGK
jgi:hypothetical protein